MNYPSHRRAFLRFARFFAAVFCVAGLAAWAGGSPGKPPEILDGAKLFATNPSAIDELKSRIGPRIVRRAEGVLLRWVYGQNQSVLVSPAPTWSIGCGDGVFVVFYSPYFKGTSPGMQLTSVVLSEERCDAIVPALGDFIRSKLEGHD